MYGIDVVTHLPSKIFETSPSAMVARFPHIMVIYELTSPEISNL